MKTLLAQTTLLLLLLLLPTTLGADIAPSLEEVLRLARAQEAANAQALQRAKAIGTYEESAFVKQADAWVIDYRHRSSFDAAFSAPRYFIALRFEPANGDEGAQRKTKVVFDGSEVLQGEFVEQQHGRKTVVSSTGYIYPTHGGEVSGFAAFRSSFGEAIGATETLDPDKNSFLKKATLRLASVEPLVVEAVLAKRSDQITIDPLQGFNVVRWTTTIADRKDMDTTAEWVREADFWHIKSYDTTWWRTDKYTRRTIAFSSVTREHDIPDPLFTVNALGLPPLTQIADYRFNPIRNYFVGLPLTDATSLDRVLDEWQKSAARLSEGHVAKDEGSWLGRNLIWIAAIATVGAAVAIAAWRLRRRRVRSTGR